MKLTSKGEQWIDECLIYGKGVHVLDEKQSLVKLCFNHPYHQNDKSTM